MLERTLERLNLAHTNHRSDDGGFTLVELLIVIVILGVLAAIVVFSVQGITNNSKTSACKTDVSTITSASEAYYAQNSSYAASMAALQSANLIRSVPSDVSYTAGTGGAAPTITGIGC